MFNVTHSEWSSSMTSSKDRSTSIAIKDLLNHSIDGAREVLRVVMQVMFEGEMTDTLQTETGERTRSHIS
jgi:isoaspartyl peptidase/L-asparaginase-like protein (Ntn-hydrolase superfamily)